MACCQRPLVLCRHLPASLPLMKTDQIDKLMNALSQMETDPDGNIYVPESAREAELAKRHATLEALEIMLGKMKPGPYEYWDEQGNDILAAECKEGDGEPIAALAGIQSMPDEFRAIAYLLNAAPDLIRWARRGLDGTYPAAVTGAYHIQEAKKFCETIAMLSDGEIVCKLADLMAERDAARDALASESQREAEIEKVQIPSDSQLAEDWAVIPGAKYDEF